MGKSKPEAGMITVDTRGQVEFYVGGQRAPSGRFVGLAPSGGLSISAELGATIDLKQFTGLKIGKDTTANHLILQPADRNDEGALCWTCKTATGRTLRVSAAGALRYFGLMPEKVTRYEAHWLGDTIVVDLGTVISTTAPRAARTSGKGGVTWAGTTTCRECGREVSYRLVDGHKVLRAHQAPDGVPCAGIKC